MMVGTLSRNVGGSGRGILTRPLQSHFGKSPMLEVLEALMDYGSFSLWEMPRELIEAVIELENAGLVTKKKEGKKIGVYRIVDTPSTRALRRIRADIQITEMFDRLNIINTKYTTKNKGEVKVWKRNINST